MKKLIVITFMMFIVMMAFNSAKSEVSTGIGDLKIRGILQAWYYSPEKEDDYNAFLVKRCRLLFNGSVVPDKVKYFIQTDFAQKDSHFLDMKLIFSNYIPKTDLEFGRYLPLFGNYMYRAVSTLDFINYPLVETRYAMWRQIGLTSSTNLDFLKFNLGVFNGYPANSTAETNDAKDFLARVEVAPFKGFTLSGFGWFGKRYVQEKDEDVDANRYGFFALYEGEELPIKAFAEYIMGKDDEIDSNGYCAQLSFKFFEKKFEVLARYEAFDPNADAEKDAEDWITIGINYYLEKLNSAFYLNYIMKGEEGTEVDNDEIILQAQIWF